MVDHFSRQPAEIRNKIYGMVYDRHVIRIGTQKTKLEGKSALKLHAREDISDWYIPGDLGIYGLLLVNREIRNDAMAEILRSKTFAFNDYMALSLFVKNLKATGRANLVHSIRYDGYESWDFNSRKKRMRVFNRIKKLPNLGHFVITAPRSWFLGISSEHIWLEDDQARARLSATIFAEELESAMKNVQKVKERAGQRFALDEFLTLEKGIHDSQMVEDFITDIFKLLKQGLGEV